jgi:hypothetical protein
MASLISPIRISTMPIVKMITLIDMKALSRTIWP